MTEDPADPERVGAVTRLLEEARDGRDDAAGELVQLVYAELREMAQARLASRSGDTLQPTALVHEAWMRLLGRESASQFENRRHFFGAAARAMRDILVDGARRRLALKRGGDAKLVSEGQTSVDLGLVVTNADDTQLLAVHEALDRLAAGFPRAAEIVQQRYFAGLGESEVALALGVSRATVAREWRFARAWLRDHVEAR